MKFIIQIVVLGSDKCRSRRPDKTTTGAEHESGKKGRLEVCVSRVRSWCRITENATGKCKEQRRGERNLTRVHFSKQVYACRQVYIQQGDNGRNGVSCHVLTTEPLPVIKAKSTSR